MEGRYLRGVLFNGPIHADSYLCQIPAVQYLMSHPQLSFTSNVTFLVGENGTGKSTLVEAIALAYGFNGEGGSKNFHFSTQKTCSELWENLTLVKSGLAKDGYFLRAESFYNLATNLDAMDEVPAYSPKLISNYGGKSLHALSHGESFLALIQNRFGGNGLYILDEPEAALSPTRQLALLAEMDRLVKENSQFIIATHSPILMAFPEAQILQLSESGIEEVSYRETENYMVTRQFLEKPEQMLKHLLGEE